jgi:uncharacterized protein YjiS (DUF1127 family)
MTIIAIFTAVAAVLGRWRRNHRERRALALLPAHERYEIGFNGDVEIAKPFWRE